MRDCCGRGMHGFEQAMNMTRRTRSAELSFNCLPALLPGDPVWCRDSGERAGLLLPVKRQRGPEVTRESVV